jgi:hypothetical protein
MGFYYCFLAPISTIIREMFPSRCAPGGRAKLLLGCHDEQPCRLVQGINAGVHTHPIQQNTLTMGPPPNRFQLQTGMQAGAWSLLPSGVRPDM